MAGPSNSTLAPLCFPTPDWPPAYCTAGCKRMLCYSVKDSRFVSQQCRSGDRGQFRQWSDAGTDRAPTADLCEQYGQAKGK